MDIKNPNRAFLELVPNIIIVVLIKIMIEKINFKNLPLFFNIKTIQKGIIADNHDPK